MLGLVSAPALRALFLSLGVLSLASTSCGGSSTSPPADGSADRTSATGGAGGGAAAGGGTTGTATGGAGGGGGTAATGGAGGSAAGGTGGADAAAGAGGTDAASAAGDTNPTSGDAAADKAPGFSLDSLPADGLTLGDGGPTVIPCPGDVATGTCTTGVICVRIGTGGSPEGCGCTLAQRWICPGIGIGADGGLAPSDGGVPDVAGVPACTAGTTSGGSCSTQGAVCTGVGMFGCACTMLAGSLRWFCY
jgi:hypothetical protein